ncbi:MAG: hypothetical protein HC888_00060 [Candidatus Competibacteraceae bacterium]|nr:hypothetical protein [Candidatus Competibacteraceae bacterium]
MPAITANEGLRYLLQDFKFHQWYIRLFRNNFTPSVTSNPGDFHEANYSGYGTATLSVSAFPVLSGNQAEVTSGGLLWQHNGGLVPNVVYGYYVTNDTQSSGVVLYEKFSVPVTFDTADDSLSMQIKFTLRSI